MMHEDMIRMMRESGLKLHNTTPPDAIERFVTLVAAEKDKEIERLLEDTKRLDWCISVLHSQNEKDSYLVTDTGCGCCGEGKYFDCSISGRDAIDAAIRARGEA